MSIPKVKYQLYSFNVTAANQAIQIDFESDKLYKTVTGINLLLTDNNARFSTIQLDVNGQEVFPEHFEVIRIRFRPNAPFGYDYHNLREPAGGSKIKGKYKDFGIGASYPYTVTLTLRLENRELTDAGKIE